MARVLGVGVATLDCVQVVKNYPVIDSEQRADQQYLWRGGNASNTLSVLSQLGEQCSLFATLADDVFAERICSDLEHYNIDYSFCPRIANTQSPTSHILLSSESGSRNITHYRNLRELTEQDSDAIDFSKWDWIHFEGRNIETTLNLLQHIKQHYPRIRVSVEIEKHRQGIEQLYHYANSLLFSRAYIRAAKFETAKAFLQQLQTTLSHSCDLICAWGEQGARALSSKGIYYEVPALNINVIDTRAAGDVFNAAFIHSRLQGHDVEKSIAAACRLAGIKCGQLGIDGLSD